MDDQLYDTSMKGEIKKLFVFVHMHVCVLSVHAISCLLASSRCFSSMTISKFELHGQQYVWNLLLSHAFVFLCLLQRTE